VCKHEVHLDREGEPQQASTHASEQARMSWRRQSNEQGGRTAPRVRARGAEAVGHRRDDADVALGAREHAELRELRARARAELGAPRQRHRGEREQQAREQRVAPLAQHRERPERGDDVVDVLQRHLLLSRCALRYVPRPTRSDTQRAGTVLASAYKHLLCQPLYYTPVRAGVSSQRLLQQVPYAAAGTTLTSHEPLWQVDITSDMIPLPLQTAQSHQVSCETSQPHVDAKTSDHSPGSSSGTRRHEQLARVEQVGRGEQALVEQPPRRRVEARERPERSCEACERREARLRARREHRDDGLELREVAVAARGEHVEPRHREARVGGPPRGRREQRAHALLHRRHERPARGKWAEVQTHPSRRLQSRGELGHERVV
jgi:hypothetical protein